MPLSNRRVHSVSTLALAACIWLLAVQELRAQQSSWQLGVFTVTEYSQVMGDPNPTTPRVRWIPVGVKVTKVVPGSKASENGISPGDVIYSVNGDRVLTPEKLGNAVRSSGGNLKVRMKTEDGTITKSISLADKAAGLQPVSAQHHVANNLGITFEVVPYSDGTVGARLVANPLAGTPAAQLGLEKGDTIYVMDNLRFRGPDDVRNHKGWTTMQLINVRTGVSQSAPMFYIP
jgi:S1-C subfamily serine protease